MAQYKITHTCGHTQSHNLLGKSADRTRKIDWFKTTQCGDCYTARMTASATIVSADLLPLTGSEKQIAWAMRIRSDRRARIEEYINSGMDQAERAGVAASVITEQTDAPKAAVMAQTSASWWIDRRDRDARSLLLEAQESL